MATKEKLRRIREKTHNNTSWGRVARAGRSRERDERANWQTDGWTPGWRPRERPRREAAARGQDAVGPPGASLEPRLGRPVNLHLRSARGAGPGASGGFGEGSAADVRAGTWREPQSGGGRRAQPRPSSPLRGTVRPRRPCPLLRRPWRRAQTPPLRPVPGAPSGSNLPAPGPLGVQVRSVPWVGAASLRVAAARVPVAA